MKKTWERIQNGRFLVEKSFAIGWHALFPIIPRAGQLLYQEGFEEFSKKLAGDSLAAVLRNSGPVFIKLGQILSTREDLLGTTVCQRLEILYNKQPAAPYSQVKSILKKRKIWSHIKSIERKALGVGSIGQVHRATLKTGETLILKILRPGVARQITQDIAQLKNLVERLFSTASVRASLDPALRFTILKLLENLGKALVKEVDLVLEKEQLSRFAHIMKGRAELVVPKVFEEWCDSELLVMEELKGESLSDYRKRNSQNSVALKKYAGIALKEVLRQVFTEGAFHADPHMGNLIVLADGRLGFIDFGLTGELSNRDRAQLGKAIKALMAKDAEKLIQSLLGFGEIPPDFNEAAFRDEVIQVVQAQRAELSTQLLGNTEAQADGTSSLEHLVNDLFTVAYRHHIAVPESSILIIKTLVTIEGVARRLDPGVNVAAIALPILLKATAKSWWANLWR